MVAEESVHPTALSEPTVEAINRLRGVYFLDQLTPPELIALAGYFQLKEYLQGEEILIQGELTTRFFIVEAGYVNLRQTDRDGFEKAIGSKAAGEYFGVKMFTTQEPSEYTFESVGAASLWVIERSAWDVLLGTHPDILDHMPELRAEYARLTGGLDWLSPGEVIDLATRRHWWALLLMVRLPVLFLLVVLGAFFVSLTFRVMERLEWTGPAFVALIVFGALWVLWEGVNWFNDTYIVTNKRVVRINRVLFISDSRNEIAIEKIQSQTVERGGPISVLLNISDLHLTSAASDTPGVVFDQVGNVERVQRAIDTERKRVSARLRAAERERLRHQISHEIQHYVFQQPNADEADERSKVTARKTPTGLRRLFRRRAGAMTRVPLSKRVFGFWNSLLGTELRDGATVTWRKHYIILLSQVGWPLIALLALILFAAFVMATGIPLGLAANGIYAVLGVLMLIAFAFVLWQWEDWRRDLYRLTDSEIVDIESLPFGLRYDEKKAALGNIQDVATSRPRLLNTLLDFGNVDSRVAGNAAPFTFTSVAHPKLVADEIQERIQVRKLKQTDEDTRRQTRTIVDAIVAYHRLMVADSTQKTLPPGQVLVPQPPIAPPPPLEPPHLPYLPGGGDVEFPPE